MTTDTPERCRACGARLAPGADWCSLCLAPVSAPVSAPDSAPDSGSVPGPPTDGATAPEEAARPVAEVDPQATSEAAGDDEAAAERMLARLRAESAQQRPLGGGPLAGASRGALLGLGVLLALGASAVVVGLLWLVGLAL